MRTLILMAPLALVLAACGNTKTAEEPVRPVIAMQVQAGGAGARDVYSGELHARYETDLGFRVAGKMVARLVDAGATVRKGQELARLDPQDARLAADASRAQLTAAESDFALAKSELDRYDDLLAKKFISQSAFDAKQNAYTAAKGRLEQARSQSAITHNQASYTTLVADADGVVVSVAAEPGQVVTAGQAILKLARAGEKEVLVNAPEGQLSRFRVGQDVAVSLWADGGNVLRGRIREVAGGADPVTRTYTVRVSVVEPPPTAKIGMTANVIFKARAEEAVLVVPMTALARTRSDPAVWIVDPASKQVKLRPIAIGQFREDGATVTSGLQPGEWVVTAGVHKLRENQVVRLAQAPTAVETARN